jgi:glycosyltransferase involved in cell wall biosynthesis
VSVVIPTYNRAEIIGRAIRSVQAQTFEDWELIIVDDASEDETEEVVAAFEDTRIRYIQHVENRGGAAARNTGIKHSKGKYIAFLDSDDKWLAKKIEGQLRVFREKDERVGLVYTGLRREGHRRGTKLPEHHGWVAEELILKNPIGSCSVGIVKAEAARRVGGFDEDLPSAQDKDFWLRISRKYKVSYLSGVHVVKGERMSGDQISRNHRSKCAGRLNFYNKHKEKISDTKKFIYLKNMGRLFRTHMDEKRHVVRKCYLISLKEETKVGRIDPEIILFLIIFMMPRGVDMRIGRMVRRFKNLLGIRTKVKGYEI